MTNVVARFILRIDPKALTKLRQIKAEAHSARQALESINKVVVSPKINSKTGLAEVAKMRAGVKSSFSDMSKWGVDASKKIANQFEKDGRKIKKSMSTYDIAQQALISARTGPVGGQKARGYDDLYGTLRSHSRYTKFRDELIGYVAADRKQLRTLAKQRLADLDKEANAVKKVKAEITKASLATKNFGRQAKLAKIDRVFAKGSAAAKEMKDSVAKAERQMKRLSRETERGWRAGKGYKFATATPTKPAEVQEMYTKFDKLRARGVSAYTKITRAGGRFIKMLNTTGISMDSNYKKAIDAQAVYGQFATYAILTASALRTLNVVLSAVNTWTNLENKVRLVSNGLIDMRVNLQKLYVTAQKTWSDLSAVSVTFQRTEFAMRKMGRSADEAHQVVEALTTAIKTTGVSAHEATGALRQITQALNKGKLDGDEFRSVSENMPIVMDAIAKAAGKTRAQLFEMAQRGLITNKLVVEGLIKALPSLREELLKVQFTTSDAWVQIRNAFTGLGGQFEDTYGWVSLLVEYMQKFARGLKQISTWLGVASDMSPVAQSEREAYNLELMTDALLNLEKARDLATKRAQDYYKENIFGAQFQSWVDENKALGDYMVRAQKALGSERARYSRLSKLQPEKADPRFEEWLKGINKSLLDIKELTKKANEAEATYRRHEKNVPRDLSLGQANQWKTYNKLLNEQFRLERDYDKAKIEWQKYAKETTGYDDELGAFPQRYADKKTPALDLIASVQKGFDALTGLIELNKSGARAISDKDILAQSQTLLSTLTTGKVKPNVAKALVEEPLKLDKLLALEKVLRELNALYQARVDSAEKEKQAIASVERKLQSVNNEYIKTEGLLSRNKISQEEYSKKIIKLDQRNEGLYEIHGKLINSTDKLRTIYIDTKYELEGLVPEAKQYLKVLKAEKDRKRFLARMLKLNETAMQNLEQKIQSDLIKTLKEANRHYYDFMRTVGDTATQIMGEVVNDILGSTTGLGEKLGNIFNSIFDQVVDYFHKSADAAAEMAGQMADGATSAAATGNAWASVAVTITNLAQGIVALHKQKKPKLPAAEDVKAVIGGAKSTVSKVNWAMDRGRLSGEERDQLYADEYLKVKDLIFRRGSWLETTEELDDADKLLKAFKPYYDKLQENTDALEDNTQALQAEISELRLEADIQRAAAQDLTNRTGIQTVTQVQSNSGVAPPPPAPVFNIYNFDDRQEMEDEMGRHPGEFNFVNNMRKNAREVADFVA